MFFNLLYSLTLITFITQTSLSVRDGANHGSSLLDLLYFLKEFFSILDFIYFHYRTTFQCQTLHIQHVIFMKAIENLQLMVDMINHLDTYHIYIFLGTDAEFFQTGSAAVTLWLRNLFAAFRLANLSQHGLLLLKQKISIWQHLYMHAHPQFIYTHLPYPKFMNKLVMQ